MSGLLRLLSCCYGKVALFVDQLDTIWIQMNLREREKFIGSISELIRLSGNSLILVMVADPTISTEIRAPYFEEAMRVIPGFENNILKVEEFTDELQVCKVLNAYLESDLGRQEMLDTMEAKGIDPLFPFNEDSIKQLLQQTEGNISKILVACANLIELGVKNSHEEITPDLFSAIF